MEKQEYLDKVMKKVYCAGKKRRNIREELKGKMEDLINGGKTIEGAISEIGTVNDVSKRYNEKLGMFDKIAFYAVKVLKIVVSVAAALLVIWLIGSIFMPKKLDITGSEVFDKAAVEDMTKQIIEMVESEDADSIKEISSARMERYATVENIKSTKEAVAKTWGNRVSIESIDSMEIVQMKKHAAACQVIIQYDNTKVMYTVIFDDNMEIYDMYLK